MKEKLIIFCKDSYDQVLYLFQTDLPSISIIQQRDKNTEECFTHICGQHVKGKKTHTRQKMM